MIRRPPRSTRTDTLFPYTTLFRSILLRLDALVSDGSKTMAHDLVTVEHVLPQQPRSDSGWVGWIASPQERSAWVHRLGNLALLNRKKNSAAGNYDVARKKAAYFRDRKSTRLNSSH